MSSSSDAAAPGAIGDSQLRQRLAQPAHQAESPEQAREKVVELNAAEAHVAKDKKTYGRTPQGTVFVVPETHDMVSTLFSPTEPKNLSDAVVLTILSLKVLAVLTLPRSVSIPLFALLFLFWRAGYNGGIGYVLKQQSECNSVVAWARRSGIFEAPASGRNHYAAYHALLKRELETKIPRDYAFEDAPIEYNSWLLFRRGVDLILMCDFVSYCCFAVACGGTPPGEHLLMTALRWSVGILLVLFNLWVKLDAHRVVKDYAWYWGDFFFLIDQELTFDGVFEMAPHPMYTVGYAGFYGISLLAASYKVLFISIIGHAAQLVFLTLVENPHIEKTYDPPPRRQRPSDSPPSLPAAPKVDGRDLDPPATTLSPPPQPASLHMPLQQRPSAVRDIIGIQNIDLHRVIDNSAVLLQLYMFALAALTPSTPFFQALFVLHAIGWRIWYSLGIGYILDRQSRKKNWTRHFVKYGESVEEAWRQWKGVYHLSMIMCHASFVSAAWKMYSLPEDWQGGLVLLRHVVGLALIALHLWTVVSIYESLGEFGWFFGDFFFDTSSKLTYGGIYRYLNNPERVLGLAGLWGVALITSSKAIFFLAVLGHTLSLCVLQFVEQPHMQKRYGQRLRHESGLSKTLHRSMPKPLRDWESSIDQVIERFMDQVEERIDIVRPQLYAYIDSTAVWLHSTLSKYPSQVGMARVSPVIVGLDRKNYSLQVHGEAIARGSADDKVSGREGETATMPPRDQQFQPLMLEYGAPIRVKWTAPINHSKRDWVGLYMVGDNTSTEVTRVSSQGRWVATSRGAFDSVRAESGILVSDKQEIKWDNERGEPLLTGEVEFAGDKLWWTTGVFEFRYHHHGKHNVLAVSEPFEVRISRFDDEASDFVASKTVQVAVEQAILPVVRNCFDRDPDIAPKDVQESFGALVEREGKFARRVVYAVWQMFGIELAPAVVKTDGNVRNLAWRICNAKQVLAPYTMTASRGAATPAEEVVKP